MIGSKSAIRNPQSEIPSLSIPLSCLFSSRNVGEAANPGKDLAELVGPLPRRCEGADAAAADACDGTAFRIVAQFDRFFGLGKYLFEDEARVLVRERVVLKAAVGLSVGE